MVSNSYVLIFKTKEEGMSSLSKDFPTRHICAIKGCVFGLRKGWQVEEKKAKEKIRKKKEEHDLGKKKAKLF